MPAWLFFLCVGPSDNLLLHVSVKSQHLIAEASMMVMCVNTRHTLPFCLRVTSSRQTQQTLSLSHLPFDNQNRHTSRPITFHSLQRFLKAHCSVLRRTLWSHHFLMGKVSRAIRNLNHFHGIVNLTLRVYLKLI